MKNDACLQIRMNSKLREEFIGICRSRERTAAQVLREFMKEYVAASDLNQPDLFDEVRLTSGDTQL